MIREPRQRQPTSLGVASDINRVRRGVESLQTGGSIMKAFRVGVFTLALLAVSFAFSTPSRAEIRWIDSVQTLVRPAAFTSLGEHVAIDGNHIIALGRYEGGQQALL